LATLFPQESRTFRSNQLCILKEKTAGSSYSEPYFKTSLSFMFFSCNPHWMEEISTLLPKNWLAETPQTLASRRLGRQSAERERISEIN
jgi:hypothetical protein